MTNNKRLTASLILGVLFLVIILGVMYIRSIQEAVPAQVTTTGETVPTRTTPTSAWNVLLETTPFAYFTPLPAPVASAIDGTYAKVDQSWPQWWKCLRCADYRAVGGIWKLQFDKGIMRIFYEVNKWRSIASYSVEGDRLFIFNDPYCPEHTGEYKWSVEKGALNLEAVSDPCAFDLRAENLTKQNWSLCMEPGGANAATSSGDAAPGCEESHVAAPDAITPEAPLQVRVFGGDSRFFEKPPDVIAHANANDMAPPEGISVSFAQESIPYGLQRVVWWNGDWIEATSDGSYTSMGVQFLGEEMIGWARVLFDGKEVWRGNTSEIWSKSGRHGGFVEVSGFPPGTHALRVESLGFDYRPVTVASFGFSLEGGVNGGAPPK